MFQRAFVRFQQTNGTRFFSHSNVPVVYRSHKVMNGIMFSITLHEDDKAAKSTAYRASDIAKNWHATIDETSGNMIYTFIASEQNYHEIIRILEGRKNN